MSSPPRPLQARSPPPRAHTHMHMREITRWGRGERQRARRLLKGRRRSDCGDARIGLPPPFQTKHQPPLLPSSLIVDLVPAFPETGSVFRLINTRRARTHTHKSIYNHQIASLNHTPQALSNILSPSHLPSLPTRSPQLLWCKLSLNDKGAREMFPMKVHR